MMQNKRLRAALVIAVLAATIFAFAYFLAKHPQTITQLKHVDPVTLLVLLGLYVVVSFAISLILEFSLEVGRAKIPLRETILITVYSSIINFFGPLQSGPGFRLVYLKKRHNISVRDYSFASLLYYGFFALFSGVFLCVAVLKWWQTLLVIAAIVGASLFVLKRKKPASDTHYSIEGIIKLALATLFQVCVVAVIYFLELRSVNSHIALKQAITYTGAANFALFVSLTPGAIGFRESFLLLSRRLHHISSANIFTASLIDRGVYIVFLGILFVLLLGFHAQDKLKFRKLRGQAEVDESQAEKVLDE